MKKKILIIDDQRRFDLFAFDVTYAKTSDEGLQYIKDQMWDELHTFFNVKGTPIYEILIECRDKSIDLPPVVRILSNNPTEVDMLKHLLQTEFNYVPKGLTGKMMVKQ